MITTLDSWLPAPEELAPWDRNAVMNAKRCLWVGHGSMLAPVFTTDPGVPRRVMTDDICDDCNGTGQEILKVPLHDGGHMIYELEDPAPCETCQGTGHV